MIENGAVGAISDEDPRQFAIELAGYTTPGMEVVDDQPGPDVTIRVRQVAPVPEPEPVPEVEDPAEEEAAGEED
jgi:hypothetical protein